MTIEKSYTKFILMHEKNIMSKEINSIQSDIRSALVRASAVVPCEDMGDINKLTEMFDSSMNEFKKVLIKHNLYEI